jgi:hypothetical protein
LSINNNILSGFEDEDVAVERIDCHPFDLLHHGDMLDAGTLRGIESKNKSTLPVGSVPSVNS